MARPIGRPRKTLVERVVENTFRPSRHGELLSTEDLPQQSPLPGARARRIWPNLLTLQADYRSPPEWALWSRTGDPEEGVRHVHSAYALHFSALVRQLHGSPGQGRRSN